MAFAISGMILAKKVIDIVGFTSLVGLQRLAVEQFEMFYWITSLFIDTTCRIPIGLVNYCDHNVND